MWLQTGNEKQWLAIERQRLEAAARAPRAQAAGALVAAIRLGRVLRAVLEPPHPGTARPAFGPGPDRLATR